MTTSKCYVLGYSRNENAREAARWATEQLLPDGKLVIVHSTRDLHLPAPPSTDAHERRRLGRDVVDELLLEGEDAVFDIDVEVEVVDRDPVSALCEAGARHGADAIVVGREPHSRLHMAIGTVTVELLRRSSFPVIVVPPRVDAAGGRAQARPRRARSLRGLRVR
jgi:nucleotide-binding universal stress UspA family protein